MIEDFAMYRWMIVCLVCLMLAIPLYAQHDGYPVALQRIERARETNTTTLDLTDYGLSQVPPEIGTLNNLRELSLDRNLLTTLPPEIWQLSNLEILFLSSNQLTTLPPEIGQLSNLRVLHLGYNQLMTLPSEIGQLSNLQELWLGGNQLTNLPSEIGQLGNLQVLFLYGNQLTNLPTAIGQLSELCYLDLTDNNLRYLPAALGKLNLLALEVPCLAIGGLILDYNPLISPPPEVVEQGTADVLAYLRNQAWYHLQRLIVGAASGVGLLAALMLGFRFKRRGGRKKKNSWAFTAGDPVWFATSTWQFCQQKGRTHRYAPTIIRIND